MTFPRVGAAVDWRNAGTVANWNILTKLCGNQAPQFQRQYNSGATALPTWDHGGEAIPAVPRLASYKFDLDAMISGSLDTRVKAAIETVPAGSVITANAESDVIRKQVDPTKYGKAWTRWYDVAKAANPHVTIVPTWLTWIPDIATPGRDPFILATKPDKLDGIGIDVYPRNDEPVEKGIAAILNIADAHFTTELPIYVPEWGRAHGLAGRGLHLARDARWFVGNPRVKMVAYYDVDYGAGPFGLTMDDGSLYAYATFLQIASA